MRVYRMAKTRAIFKPGYRWSIANRSLAATLGAFIAASAIAIVACLLLMRLQLMPRNEAVATTTVSAFVVYALLAMWAFYEARLRRVWGLFSIITAVSFGLLWLHRGMS